MSQDWLTEPCFAIDEASRQRALEHQSQLTKPPGSLGTLETLAVRLAGMQHTVMPSVQSVWISIFAGDHGVAAEGVSAFPQVVTGEMIRNFANGGAAISVLARSLGAMLEVVNLGTVNDPGELPNVRRAIIAPQTSNFCEQPAMSAVQLELALRAGADSAEAARQAGAKLFIGGEMGIANTTSAAALACGLLRESPSALAGAGTGLDAAGIRHKAEVIERALACFPADDDALAWLGRVGGFEIAALCGAYIGAAQRGIPVLVDGFITTAAALTAVRINPSCREWMFFAHRSRERGHARLLSVLEADPLLDLGLRLGEGSGAAAAVPLMRLACDLHARMATFAQAGVSAA
ncbi:nicotinate-nucleotide--dimethylbenzimidazole phosphoribosyltransferase [Dyella japonica]|uniref:Nicotinate-nucleotide--dimethylbenzimidazole phosphoribosyltransferase n=1 Tax=Dyella japonica DSM 16301 TaxID=1440762 RepID=A0A0G9H698_9GAMM|nr:nicotinate-nucleotide--dimethylbenzimidazole phosphoribosyltransferase [Dyella japonica]KLD64739.1 nicotinate-nucleotide--dimethylbenzimidazole phosphoribosyltransferase [Dyella japonica DSM 16301]